ncbi:MAG: zf-TFIIB domain-containing protein [Candidatus Aureabacteria bacterium]|nr:zf-TFIIB domain-containing protein [Candidatus Auribacterota bacterium]
MKKYHCSKCNVSLEESRVQPIKSGIQIMGYMCPKCHGPCFEEEVPVSSSEKNPPEKALLDSKPFRGYKGLWIILGVLLLGYAVLHISWNYHTGKNLSKTRKMLETHREKMDKDEEQGKGHDIFDHLDPVLQNKKTM